MLVKPQPLPTLVLTAIQRKYAGFIRCKFLHLKMYLVNMGLHKTIRLHISGSYLFGSFIKVILCILAVHGFVQLFITVAEACYQYYKQHQQRCIELYFFHHAQLKRLKINIYT